MKHSAADWCYLERSGLPPAEYYRQLRAAGFSGVEMVAPQRRSLARAAGLQLVTQSVPDLERGLNHRAHHEWLIPVIRDALDDAHANQVQNLIVFSGRRAALSEAEGIAACADGLRAVAAHAEQAGVTLLLEVLNEFDHVDQQCSRMAFARPVIEAVGSRSVKMLYDLYHGARMGDDLTTWDAATVALIGHIHVAACEGRSCPRPGATPDYTAIVPAIVAAGYQGFWGHEFFPGSDVLGDLSASRAYLQPGQALQAGAASRSSQT